MNNSRIRVFIVYKLDTWPEDLKSDYTLKDCLFGAVKLTKNANPDKYSYSGYSFEFDSCSRFSIPNFDWSKNPFIFGAEIVHQCIIKKRKKDILHIISKMISQ